MSRKLPKWLRWRIGLSVAVLRGEVRPRGLEALATLYIFLGLHSLFSGRRA